MSHLYANAVLRHILPLLRPHQFTEVAWDDFSSPAGISGVWVTDAIAELVKDEVLELEVTDGRRAYRPNVDHPVFTGLAWRNSP